MEKGLKVWDKGLGVGKCGRLQVGERQKARDGKRAKG